MIRPVTGKETRLLASVLVAVRSKAAFSTIFSLSAGQFYPGLPMTPRFFQIGEKYGKPIIVRAYDPK
jgi:predicted proteasome-type protease